MRWLHLHADVGYLSPVRADLVYSIAPRVERNTGGDMKSELVGSTVYFTNPITGESIVKHVKETPATIVEMLEYRPPRMPG